MPHFIRISRERIILSGGKPSFSKTGWVNLIIMGGPQTMAMASSALVIFPRTGHALNLEEPVLFNQVLGDFLHRVDVGAWSLRDPRADPKALLRRET